MDIRIEEWISRLEENFASQRKYFDFAQWAVYLSFDVVADFSFGKPLGFVAKGSDVDGMVQDLRFGELLAALSSRSSLVQATLTRRSPDSLLGPRRAVPFHGMGQDHLAGEEASRRYSGAGFRHRKVHEVARHPDLPASSSGDRFRKGR